MQIDVWADLGCPWCFIGKSRLQRALGEAGIDKDDVTIVHRAYQLDPHAGMNSEPTIDHLASKYGVSREQALEMMSEVTEVAATEGLDYRLDQTMTGNTREAHRLVLWVQDTYPEASQSLLTDLYSGYFEHGKRIFTLDDLLPFADRHGIPSSAARDLLEGREYLDRVAEDQATARDLGVTGVPFFVFEGKVGLSGAQPVTNFLAAIGQAHS